MSIKIITLALMAVFYICYFAKMINQRRQGISTDRLGKGKEGFVRFIEVTLKITTYLIPMIEVISIVLYDGTTSIAMRVAGVIVTAFGGIL